MKIIKSFENEDIIVSDFGEWVGKNYIDYKAEYENNQKIIKSLLNENSKLEEELKYTIGIVEHNRIINEKNREIRQLKIQIFSEKKELCNRLESNWNKLKEYLHNQIPTDKTVLTIYIKIFEVLDKMQEIEQGSDSNERL